jgi:tryptophan halogenase
MSKKRIAVIGRGTAGSFAITSLSRRFPDHEIEWYFDPNTPTQAVGEGSTIPVPRSLFLSFGFTYEDFFRVDGTVKTGIYKKNWGTKNEVFRHDFRPPSSGIHFSAVGIQKYILEKSEQVLGDRLKVIPEIVDYRNIDADYIFNASGVPKDYDDFHKSDYIPVNAAYVTQCYWDFPRFDYTLAIASKHGWVFGIPLQNRCSIGYMYNSNITTKEEIMEDVKGIFEEWNLTPSTDTISLNFNNYYRKQNYEDGGRIAHSGNSSFFLEPLEATSTGLMHKIQSDAADVWNGIKTQDEANQLYLDELRNIELMVMLHYASGSKFDTPFWQFAQERGIRKIESYKDNKQFREIYEAVRHGKDYYDAIQLPEKFVQYGDFGSWPPAAYMVNMEKLGIKPTIDRIFGE